MITVTITILLAYSLLPKETKEKKRKKISSKKSKSSRSSKSSKSSKKEKKNKKTKPKPKPEKPKHVIDVGKPIGYAHIEYTLIPGIPKYQIDVICWGTVAKIFCIDGDITLRVRNKDNKVWVPICVQHSISNLSNENLMKLHKHNVNCLILTNKNKMGKRAKREKMKVCYINIDDIDTDRTVCAYDKDPNINIGEEQEMETAEQETVHLPVISADKQIEIRSQLNFFKDNTHDYWINKIINDATIGKSIEYKSYVPICPPPINDETWSENKKGKKDKSAGRSGKSNKKSKKPKKPVKTKKNKKGNKGKKKKGKPSALKIPISGEVFFTDPILSTYSIEDVNEANANISNGYFLISVLNLMTRMQKYLLNPLIIKIKKISNLPVDVLQEHRFESVCAYFNIPYIAQCTTKEKKLDATIKLDEAHAYFTDKIPKHKLMEFLQTQRLYIEIRGIRDEKKPTIMGTMFGTEKKDKQLTNRLTPKGLQLEDTVEPTTVPLAVVCYDLSSLLNPVWDYMGKHSCHHPDNMLFDKVNNFYNTFEYTDAITINEINLNVSKCTKSITPLMESFLFDYGTSLKIEVYLSAPQVSLMQVKSLRDLYQRMFLVIYNADVAVKLLNEILIHNQEILGPHVLVVNYLTCTTKCPDTLVNIQSSSGTNMEFSSQAITGFMVDNGNYFVFFVEGLSNSFMSTIIYKYLHIKHSKGKTYFNSDHVFEKALYSEFIPYGGLYTITLQTSLENIMSHKGIYIKGNVPLPCWKALKKLNLLIKCSTMKVMCQFCLFPTPKQLISLNFEFGVPVRKRVPSSLLGFSAATESELSVHTDVPAPMVNSKQKLKFN